MGERELAMEVLGELPDQFVDYQVMKDSERHRIYLPKEPLGGFSSHNLDANEEEKQQDTSRNNNFNVI